MRRKSEAGQSIIFLALGLTALMGFAGLGIDVGVMRYEKRLQQTAADAAAIAGADEIRYAGGAGIPTAAVGAATGDGFTDNNGGALCTNTSAANCVGVVVNHPPTAGPHATQPNYVEVLVSAEHPTYFMPVLGIRQTTVISRAVATLVGASGTAPGCVYTTGVGISGDITTSGNPTLNANTCGIEDDGGLTANGRPVHINAATIGVSGTDTVHNSTLTCGGSTANCPITGIPPVTDPLSYLPQQTIAGGVNWNGTPVAGTTYNSTSITGTVNFPAGQYFINGNLTINGGATVTGTGVTFFVNGNITVNGTSTVKLSAPNTGTYAGILIDDTSPNVTVMLDGTNTSYYQGGIYVPGQGSTLVFGGNNLTNVTCATLTSTNCAQYTIIVADQLVLHGNNTLTLGSSYSTLPGGVSVIEKALLVE
jgi:Putative Flp pilus-assembly TadE/G-like